MSTSNNTSTTAALPSTPHTGAVTLSGQARVNQTLTVSNDVADADGMTGVSYVWRINGNALTLTEGIVTHLYDRSSYALKAEDVGKAVTVDLTYYDSYGRLNVVSSAPMTVLSVQDNTPATGSVTVSGTPLQGQTLSATYDVADADGMGAVTLQWLRDGQAVEGATGATYTLTQADVGKAISARADFIDLHGIVERVVGNATAGVANVNDAPTGSVSIAGSAVQGQTLTAQHNIVDPDGQPAVFNWQWLRDGAAITGAASASYKLVLADVGHAITARAVYTDALGTAESVTSEATAAVAFLGSAGVAPTITGTARQGQVLQASAPVDVDGVNAPSYQWLRGGQAIDGATGTRYTLTQADVGQALSVRVAYTDNFGHAETLTGKATAAVANVNDAPSGIASISGSAVQGQTLTASHNLSDADGLGTVSYQWLRAGTAIAGATAASYTLTQADVGKSIAVKASYVDGGNTAESSTSLATVLVSNVNDAPTGGVSITGSAAQGQTLTATNTLADADGLGAVKYQWLRDGVAINNAGAATYVLGQADVGHAVAVRASYTDKLGTAESVTSEATAAVLNINDAPTGGITVGGAARQGQVLTAVTAKLADADGLGTLSYQWLRGGVAVDGATAGSYALTQADVGQAVAVRVSYTDALGAAETVTSAATAQVANVNDAPTNGVALGGTAAQGQTLTATHTLADLDGLGAVSWQWLRAGQAIAGATGERYTLTQADVGKAITVKASYVDGFNFAESRSSAATAAVANVNDAPTGGVTLGGTAAQGQTLTASNTLADADGLGAVKYQWLRDGVAITGAAAATYVLKEADVGHAVSVRAGYVDKLGTAESVTSEATAAVANINDAPTGNVTISGAAKQGSTLTLAHATLADADGLGAMSYQWLRGGVAVDGATGTSYTLTQADVGQAITARVSYVDGHGTAESKASAATAAVANVNDVATGSVTLGGTAEVGRTLTASFELQDLDGLGPVTLQWMRGTTAITGATGTSYTLTTADADKAISVRALFTDTLGGKEAVSSGSTALVTYSPDTVTGTDAADVLHGGLGASTVSGLAGNDTLYGEAGADTLRGGEGNDTLYGGVGNDQLLGDAGDDRLVGGTGADLLTGGEGRDGFVFTALADLGATPAATDTIADFTHGQDRIDLSALDANSATSARDAFSALIAPTDDFSAAGQLKLVDGVLYGNTDADADAELVIRLVGVSTLDLSDFVLR
jgi:Ca2+-binding RTX toxin-like protein